MSSSSWTPLQLTNASARFLTSALYNAKTNYSIAKGIPEIDLGYIYMSKAEVEECVSTRRLSGSPSLSDKSPANPPPGPSWYIAVDRNAPLTGSIDVVGYGPAVGRR